MHHPEDSTEERNVPSPRLKDEITEALPKLNFIGRLVVLIFVLMPMAATAAVMFWLSDSLSTSIFRIGYVLLPSSILSLVLCVLTLHVLKSNGINVYRE